LSKIKDFWQQSIEKLDKSKAMFLFRKIGFPGLPGVPFYVVFRFFFRQLLREAIALRSAATAYSFFLALFPAMIFLFTLIPYIPVDNLQEEIIALMKQYMPGNAFQTIEVTLNDIILRKRGHLLSLGVIFSLYFASNGINTLLVAFNRNLKRPWWKKYSIAISLTFTISFLLIIAISLQIGGELFISYFKDSMIFGGSWVLHAIWFFKLITTLLLSIAAISILYYYATVKEERFRFFSPGAYVATILVVLVSYGFGYYVENFAQYNRLYGSIGAIIVLLIWLYLSAMSLISGYEFNQSVIKAKARQKYFDPGKKDN
jgi:membrane protein